MNSKGIRLRKFPFPSKCALAISSDIDNASSADTFKVLMDFFNSDYDTPLGKGLNLEIGNSFWFFNHSNHNQLSYFNNLTIKETSIAPIIRDFWESGHIDTLHSWGNFDLGGFSRSLAEEALNELHKYGIKIPVWVNHGIGLNHQKVGSYPNMFGDDSNSENYHLDLTTEAGCEYFWLGKSTHVVGQNSKSTISVQSKLLIQWLMKRIRYRKVVNPIYDDGNELLFPIQFRDGQKKWEFIRFINSWGREQVLDINDLQYQLSKRIQNQLIYNKGYMILYTHFNENVNMMGLPSGLKSNLEYLKRKVELGEIFLTTSSRLLKYKEINDNIKFSLQVKNKMTKIIISEVLHTPIGTKDINESQLSGLTFYTDFPEKTSIWFDNMEISSKINPPDETGKVSIMIPWKKLSYPF